MPLVQRTSNKTPILCTAGIRVKMRTSKVWFVGDLERSQVFHFQYIREILNQPLRLESKEK